MHSFSISFRPLLIAIVTIGLGIPSSRGAQTPQPVLSGQLYALDAENAQRILVPLESTEVVLDVKPALMEAQVIQTFTNRTASALEATYLYPLPAGATLTGFELRYRDRVVRSEVREKVAARAIYETAKAEGKKTALLEQHDPSLFSTAVANFLPGETVQIVIRFIQPLTLTADAIEVRFPMVTGEKYFPGDAAPGTEGNAAPNPARRPEEAVVQNHVYAFDIQVAGIPVHQIESPSHRVNAQRSDAGTERYLVSLAEEITIPDRDFVLRIETRPAAGVLPTLVYQHTATGDYGLVTLFPPRTRPTSAPLVRPRDVLFLLDRSGSMAGPRFASAKLGLERCIDALSAQDRFQIAIFDSHFEFYRPEWTLGSAATFEEARRYVRALVVRGGTELQPALTASLAAFEQNDRQQILILLTDGDVGNAASLLNLVETYIGQVRLFPFGIGAAPNATLIKQIAEMGRGQARFIGDDNAIARELTDLFATLDAPVISQVRLSLFDANGRPLAYSMFPERLPDVFVGRPIQTVFRTTGGMPASVAIEGLEGERPVVHRLALQQAALRGDGLERQFGSRLFADTGMMLRRAKTDEERNLIRQEMLATALQFQLVTELTSRVAVDDRISRDPNATLASEHVAQYAAADRPRMATITTGTVSMFTPSGGDVVGLTPFEVRSESDRGYAAANTLSGSRIRSSLSARDIGETIARKLIDDLAPGALDDVLALSAEPQQPAVRSQLDELPIATVVDPATIGRITIPLGGAPRAEIFQERGGRISPPTIVARLGDEGFAAVTLKTATHVGRGDALPVLTTFSWTKSDHAQTSAFLEGQKTFGETRIRTSLQARELDRYGAMRLVRGSLERKFGDSLMLEATAAWHELKRDDPTQFRLGSATAHYEGLGFFNLDSLTAESRRLGDAIARLQLSGSVRRTESFHTWSVRARWHRQESTWLTPRPGDAIAGRRENRGLDFTYRGAFAHDRLQLDAQASATGHRTPRSSVERQTSAAATAGANWKLNDTFSLFGNWSHDEILPWLSTGRWRLAGSDLVAATPEREVRAGGKVGLSVATGASRVTGFVGAFHERVRQHTFRDWSWERAHAPSPAAFADGELRSAMSTSVSPEFTRQGWMGSLDLNPSRSLAIRASWTQDWKDEGPYRGGNRRASLATRYDILEGTLKGFTAGLALSYRNDLIFDDGFRLGGGMRADAMVGYRLRSPSEHKTFLQLNAGNVTQRPWQPTRFAPDRGRQVRLSIAREF